MMVARGVLVVAAVCGSAGAAVERGDWFSAELTFDRDQIAIGESAVATLTLRSSWTSGGYFSSFLGNLIASEELVVVSDVAPIAWNNPGLGFSGVPIASGASVLGVEGVQFSLIPPVDFSNPLEVTTFTVTGIEEGDLSYQAELTNNSAGLFIWSTAFDPIYFDASYFKSETLTVVPASPALACVLGCALLAGRRRR